MYEGIVSLFRKIPDPRKGNAIDYDLAEVLIIAILAIMCGAEWFTQMELFGREKREWLSTFLKLEKGIPSHDTFGDIFAALDAEVIIEEFAAWVETIRAKISGEVISIDGKTVCASKDIPNKKKAIHVVSAWATQNRLVLGQIATDEKSNEITAIPDLLDILDISGCIITIDAIGCQDKIAKKIVAKEGHYCLSVKENQSNLYKDIDEYFRFALNDRIESKNISYHITRSYGHGRIEKRKYYVANDEDLINHINDRKKWKNLKSVGMVENTREIDGKKSVQRKYYILDIDVTAERFAEITRNHWQIENGLHWILDVHFKEDFSTSKKDNSIFNLSLLRKICYNLIKLDDSFGKISFKKKLNRYNFDFQLLENLIFNVIPQNS